MQEQLNNLERSLGRVEGKVDMILTQLGSINGQLNTHEKAIGNLNTEMGIIKEKATLFGAGAGVAIIVAWEFIKNKLFK